jgi:uncharacterized RDD family membrane protein YckC
MTHPLLAEDDREPWRFPGTEPATWLQRVTAAAIDRCIPAVTLVLIVTAVGVVVDPLVGASRPSAGTVELYGLLVWLVLGLVAAALEGYNLCWLQGRTGQSFGKRVVGLHLVHLDDGLPVGPAAALKREVTSVMLLVVCVLPGVLNLLAPAWATHGRNLSDRVVDAIVVSAR